MLFYINPLQYLKGVIFESTNLQLWENILPGKKKWILPMVYSIAKWYYYYNISLSYKYKKLCYIQSLLNKTNRVLSLTNFQYMLVYKLSKYM